MLKFIGAVLVVAVLLPFAFWTWESTKPVRTVLPSVVWTKASSERVIDVHPERPLIAPGSTLRLRFGSARKDEDGGIYYGPGVGGIRSIAGSIAVAGDKRVSLGIVDIPSPGGNRLRSEDVMADFTIPFSLAKSTADVPVDMLFTIEYQEYHHVRSEGKSHYFGESGISSESVRAVGTMLTAARASQIKALVAQSRRRVGLFALAALVVLVLFYVITAYGALFTDSMFELPPAMIALTATIFLLDYADAEEPGEMPILAVLFLGILGGAFIGAILRGAAERLASRFPLRRRAPLTTW